ncbi:MAG: histidine kinase [Bacteroidia bacterium]
MSTLGVLVLILFLVFIVVLYQKRMLANKTLLIDTENKHQKKLLNASLEIAEQERVKIAVNLHDDIGITLSVLKLNLSRLKKNIDKKEVFDEIINASNQNIDDSLDTVRSIYNDIIPPTLMNLGFVKGLKEVCHQISFASGTDIIFNSEEENIEFEKKIKIQLYRLVKEVLNNTIKHAKPLSVEMNIEIKKNNLIVSILHNGIGITTEAIKLHAEKSTGLGLKSILTRTELINAAIEFTILKNSMAQVTIKTPLI